MGVRFLDSFDHYTTVLQKYTSVNNAGQISIGAFGRTVNGLKLIRINGSNTDVNKTIPGATLSSGIVGFAYKMNGLGQAGSDNGFFQLLEGGVAGTIHVSLGLDSTGRLKVYRGFLATLLGSGTAVLLANTFYSIELKFTIHDTTGSVEVRVNEAVDISVSGVDTRNGGTGACDTFRLSASNPGAIAGPETIFDDLYFTDSSTYLGDVQVRALLPTADGAHTDFAPSAGALHYPLVDDAAPNDDTDYVSSAAVGARDCYAMTQITDNPIDVKALQYFYRAETSDAGARSIRGFFRSASGVDYDNSLIVALSNAYLYPTAVAIEETNPETAAAWQRGEINGGQFGVKVQA